MDLSESDRKFLFVIHLCRLLIFSYFDAKVKIYCYIYLSVASLKYYWLNDILKNIFRGRTILEKGNNY